MSRFLAPLAQARTYLETADACFDLAVGVVWFSIFTTLVATGAGLLITLVGLPILTATFHLARGAAVLERRRARIFLGIALEPPARAAARSGSAWSKLFAPIRDRTTWKELVYVSLVQPLQSVVSFTVAVTAWFVPLWALTLPVYATHTRPKLWNGARLDTWHEIVPVALAGLILLPVAPWAVRAVTAADRAAARWGLGGSRPAPRAGAVQGPPQDPARRSANLTLRAARWSAAHRRTAVLGWLAFVLVAFAVGSTTGVVHMTTADNAIGDSGKADTTLAREFPKERSLEEVLIQSRTGGPMSPASLRSAVSDLVARLSRTPSVASIASPLEAGNARQVSKDGASALVTFQITGDPDTAQDRVGPPLAATAAAQRAHPTLLIGEVGVASAMKAIDKRIADDFQRAELTSLPVTLVILVLAFGALVAAGIPLLLGLTSVAAALGLTAVLSHVLHVDPSINSVILLIGLAVGVDYSLFYLRREREERARGRTPSAALEAAAATSGRAVLVAGLTVMTAMAGMFLMGSHVFWSFGMGTILVVAIAVVGSLSVLPAVLSKLGDRVDRGRLPLLGRAGRNGGSRFWSAIVGAVLRRPLVWGGLATALLVVLALPALRLHTVNPGVQGLPHDMPVMKVYDRAVNAFPGQPQPAIVVLSARDVTASPVTAGIAALRRAAVATGQMREPISVDVAASHRTARVRIPLAGTTTDAASNRALELLRDTVIPATIGRVPGVVVHTTGETATSRDFNNSMKSHAPFVFAFVFSLAFLLLLVTFRSIVIPIKAIVLNLLSVAASYGVLVLVFQDGRLESPLDFQSVGGITSWLPLFLFVVLFGLSMDYHVLILSRVREDHDNGMPTRDAVAHGIRATAGVVTSAAVVMVAVFAIFATLGLLDMKMMGVGLAVAVLLDATVVRAVLLPAAMVLLGDWNWYLPRWLAWLPNLSAGNRVEDADEQREARPALSPG